MLKKYHVSLVIPATHWTASSGSRVIMQTNELHMAIAEEQRLECLCKEAYILRTSDGAVRHPHGIWLDDTGQSID